MQYNWLLKQLHLNSLPTGSRHELTYWLAQWPGVKSRLGFCQVLLLMFKSFVCPQPHSIKVLTSDCYTFYNFYYSRYNCTSLVVNVVTYSCSQLLYDCMRRIKFVGNADTEYYRQLFRTKLFIVYVLVFRSFPSQSHLCIILYIVIFCNGD